MENSLPEVVEKPCRRCGKVKKYLIGRRRICNICLKKNTREYNKKYFSTYKRKPLTEEQKARQWVLQLKYYQLNYPCAVNRRERNRKRMRERLQKMKKGTMKYRLYLNYKNGKRRERNKLRKLGIYRDRRYLVNRIFKKNPLAFREIPLDENK